MALVRVLVDSVACLPPDLAGKNGIAVISVRIAAGGTTYRDTPEDLPPELVSQLQESGRIDTTPWPPEHYCERYLTWCGYRHADSRCGFCEIHVDDGVGPCWGENGEGASTRPGRRDCRLTKHADGSRVRRSLWRQGDCENRRR